MLERQRGHSDYPSGASDTGRASVTYNITTDMVVVLGRSFGQSKEVYVVARSLRDLGVTGRR